MGYGFQDVWVKRESAIGQGAKPAKGGVAYKIIQLKNAIITKNYVL